MNSAPQESWNSRTELLLGAEGLAKLSRASVTVCGLGGVGSYIAEALVRSGIGELTLIDHDRVAESNINRQLGALRSTVGQNKTAVMAARLADINPECRLIRLDYFIEPENARQLLEPTDYIADAIDYLPGKLALVQQARELHIPIICAMGAGRRLDPSQLQIADISHSFGCPLARRFRRALKDIGIESGVSVAFSSENPQPAAEGENGQRAPIGSYMMVPATMGLLMAAHMIREIVNG